MQARFAIVAAATALAATASADTSAAWQDKPEFPAARTIQFAWQVGADRPDPKNPDGLPLHPVELDITVGSVTRKLSLEPMIGGLSSYNQVACRGPYPLAQGEIGKITGGAGGYAIRRTSPDVLEIHRWFQVDGACERADHSIGACPGEDDLVARLHVPATASTIGGQITAPDDTGKIKPLVCPPREP